MQDPPALHEANPLGKVPALVLANGDTLFDSPLICEYLDSTLEGETMIPLAHPERWPVLRFQALADGIMDAAVAIIMERGRKDSEQSEIWLGRWHRAIDRSLQILDDEVTKLDGPVDLSHIAVGSSRCAGMAEELSRDRRLVGGHEQASVFCGHSPARILTAAPGSRT